MKRFQRVIAVVLCFAALLSTLWLPSYAADNRIEQAMKAAVAIANDQSHGYSQTNRYGNPDYDCSSFVYKVFYDAGFGIRQWGNTSSLPGDFKAAGFTYITNIDFTKTTDLQRGDILWRSGHVEIYMGNGQIVGAHSADSTAAHPNRSPKSGDQGDEISVTAYYNAPWSGVLRYQGSAGYDRDAVLKIVAFLKKLLQVFRIVFGR
ncbi:MAG: C40 family peptidase [Clostridia bacterium]|nr:C40 family peptidase [Clostridia bacterium]